MKAYDDLLFAFREHLRIKSYSPATISSYSDHLRMFFAYLGAIDVRDVKRVTREHLQNYRLRLSEHRSAEGQGYSVLTVCLKVRAVKRMFEYLEATNRILVNPAETLKEPKKETRLPRAVLTVAEARKILDAPNLSLVHGIRDRALLEVLYSTGVRVEEVTGLTIFDCDLQGGMLRVKGKGSKDRVIPFGRHAVRFLKEYLTKVRPHYTRNNKAERCLFINQLGKPLSKQMVEIQVRKYGKAAGIQKRVTPHVFRHTFATELLRNGADITAVQKMLGHSDLSVTHLYTRVAGVEVKKTHRLSHPRERDTPVKEEITPDIKSVKGPYHRE